MRPLSKARLEAQSDRMARANAEQATRIRELESELRDALAKLSEARAEIHRLKRTPTLAPASFSRGE